MKEILLSLDETSKRELLDALSKELTSNPELGKYKDELSINQIIVRIVLIVKVSVF